MDKNGYSINRYIFWATEIIIMIISVVSLFLDIYGIIPNVKWQWVAIGAIIIFTFIAFRQLLILDNDLFSKVPKVSIAQIQINPVDITSTVPIFLSAKGDNKKVGNSEFIHVLFQNNPKHNTENNHANNVVAYLTYRDDNKKILVNQISGRWSQSNPPKSYRDIPGILRWTIKSDGIPESLDIAYRIKGDNVLYAYNNDNYFMNDMKEKSRELRTKIIHVDIELRGERLKRNFHMVIFNDTVLRVE